MRFVAHVAAACIALFVAGVADADTPKERADKLFEDGRKYLSAKEYALACTAFEQSHASDPAIGTQLNIALCYEEWGKTASAYRAYVEAERLARIKFDDRAKGARKKLDELAPKVPRLRLELPSDADPSVVILFDAKQLALEKLSDDLLVDPGAHEVEARISGRTPKATKIEVGNGERKVITIDIPPAPAVVIGPPPLPPRRTGRLYGGIALISIGVISIGAASVLSLGARQDYNDAIEKCPQFVCTTKAAFTATQDARKRANMMTYVGVGGAVLATTGLVLVLTSRGKATEKAQPVSLVPVFDGDQVGLAIGGDL
jgi:tetratricopeptide (TPR) repeat protein